MDFEGLQREIYVFGWEGFGELREGCWIFMIKLFYYSKDGTVDDFDKLDVMEWVYFYV